MTGWNLSLQAYVEADGYGPAFTVAMDLLAAVAPVASIRACTVGPYAKFPGQYGVRLTLEAPDLQDAYDSLKAGLAPTWTLEEHADEAAAIWDRRVHGPAPIATLAWMHLNLFPLSDD